MLQGVDYCSHPVLDSEFGNDRGDVSLDRGLTEPQPGCDLLVGLSVDDKCQYFVLSL